jgi:hypothetical protein
MSANEECPLCRLQRRTSELLKDRKAEDLASCAAMPLEMMALQVRIGCRLLAAGAFFVANGLCATKSFAQSPCPSAAGRQAMQEKEGDHGRA